MAANLTAADNAAHEASVCQAEDAESSEPAAATDSSDSPDHNSLRILWPQDVLYDNIVQVHAFRTTDVTIQRSLSIHVRL